MRSVFRVAYFLSTLLVLSGFFGARGAAAQNPTVSQTSASSAASRQENESQAAATKPSESSDDANRVALNSSSLLLGPGDELEITVYGAPDLSSRTRISDTGNVSIPLIGYV